MDTKSMEEQGWERRNGLEFNHYLQPGALVRAHYAKPFVDFLILSQHFAEHKSVSLGKLQAPRGKNPYLYSHDAAQHSTIEKCSPNGY